jgi:hypothetical protein
MIVMDWIGRRTKEGNSPTRVDFICYCAIEHANVINVGRSNSWFFLKLDQFSEAESIAGENIESRFLGFSRTKRSK